MAAPERFVVRTTGNDQGPYTQEQVQRLLETQRIPRDLRLFDLHTESSITAEEVAAGELPQWAGAAEIALAPDRVTPNTEPPAPTVDTDVAAPPPPPSIPPPSIPPPSTPPPAGSDDLSPPTPSSSAISATPPPSLHGGNAAEDSPTDESSGDGDTDLDLDLDLPTAELPIPVATALAPPAQADTTTPRRATPHKSTVLAIFLLGLLFGCAIGGYALFEYVSKHGVTPIEGEWVVDSEAYLAERSSLPNAAAENSAPLAIETEVRKLQLQALQTQLLRRLVIDPQTVAFEQLNPLGQITTHRFDYARQSLGAGTYRLILLGETEAATPTEARPMPRRQQWGRVIHLQGVDNHLLYLPTGGETWLTIETRYNDTRFAIVAVWQRSGTESVERSRW